MADSSDAPDDDALIRRLLVTHEQCEVKGCVYKEAATRLAQLRAERDRAVEVADAQTKGVYSSYMLEAADAVACRRHDQMTINELRAEIAELRRARQLSVWLEKEDKLRAERDAAVADAERYRWVREQKDSMIAAAWFLPAHAGPADTPEEIDAAIDAARAAIGKGE